MKSNKEVINALQEYLVKQDAAVVARTLAALMIDMNRMLNFTSLGKNESENLIARMNANRTQLMKFIQDGPNGKLTLVNIETKDE
jgi:hypothetical protein